MAKKLNCPSPGECRWGNRVSQILTKIRKIGFCLHDEIGLLQKAGCNQGTKGHFNTLCDRKLSLVCIIWTAKHLSTFQSPQPYISHCFIKDTLFPAFKPAIIDLQACLGQQKQAVNMRHLLSSIIAFFNCSSSSQGATLLFIWSSIKLCRSSRFR